MRGLLPLRSGADAGSLSVFRSALMQRMPAYPGVHRDGGGGAGIDRTGRAELGDGEDVGAHGAGRGGESRALLTEEQNAAPWQVVGLQRHSARQIVDTQHRQLLRVRPGNKSGPVGVMPNVLVAVG